MGSAKRCPSSFGLYVLTDVTCNPHPPTPSPAGEGEQNLFFPSPAGEGLGVRAVEAST